MTSHTADVPADAADAADASTVGRWLQRANVQRSRAHAGYSGFSVGAVVVSADGNSYDGVNVENASYSLTMCAERVAIGSMVAAGDRSGIALVAVAGPGQRPLTPCGACRQVIAEFARPDTPVVARAGDGTVARWRIDELLPAAFDADRLDEGTAEAARSDLGDNGGGPDGTDPSVDEAALGQERTA